MKKIETYGHFRSFFKTIFHFCLLRSYYDLGFIFQAPLSALMLACVIPFFEPVYGEGGIIYYWPTAAWVSFRAGHQSTLIFSKKNIFEKFPWFSKPFVYRQMFYKEAVMKTFIKLDLQICTFINSGTGTFL